MKNRLKELRMEKGLTLTDVQAKTNIDFKILENLEKHYRVHTPPAHQKHISKLWL